MSKFSSYFLVCAFITSDGIHADPSTHSLTYVNLAGLGDIGIKAAVAMKPNIVDPENVCSQFNDKY